MMKHLNRKISQWHKADLYRQRVAVTSRDETYLYYNRKAYVNFSSNDYLGLAKHPIIISVMQEGVQRYGFGSASSCMISGFNAEQLAFEEQFADWLNVESVVLFNSGYMANLGVVSALAERHSVILSDRFCHASMLDGVKISRAKHYRYQHNNIKDLERLAIKYSPNIILTESIFSMEGSAAPVIDIAELAANYQSQLIIDDAHGVGVLGKLGGGVIEHFQLHPDQFLAISLSLGKSFCGMGGVVAGKKNVIEAVTQFSKTYRYTTGLPPAICCGLLSALNIIRKENWRREKLMENIDYFNNEILKRNLSLVSTDLTPIRSVLIGDNQLVLTVQKKLLEKGYFVSAVRPPSVPNNSARIRISLSSTHTKEQLLELINALSGLLV